MRLRWLWHFGGMADVSERYVSWVFVLFDDEDSLYF
jgi:hypothetical protein